MTRLSVLVVEDEPVIAGLLADVLRGLGHGVCAIAATEAEAVAAVELHDPTLMVVDAHLAEGSGIVAVDRILSRNFVPHIFTSGDRSTLATLRRRAVVLEKPFREHDLVAAIDRVFGAIVLI